MVWSHNPTATETNPAAPFMQPTTNRLTHGQRRNEMMKKYGNEIKQLKGWSWRISFIGAFLTAVNLAAGYLLAGSGISTPWLIFWGWALQGTICHTIVLVNHEASHDLIAPTVFLNKLFSIIFNINVWMPQAITFRKLHIIHHINTGVYGVDPDLPSRFEAKFFRNPITKFLWMSLQPIFYGLRPMLMLKQKINIWELANTVITLSMGFLWFNFLGDARVFWFYHALGAYLGLAVHPIAGHFISEHYVYGKPEDTYSYYGSGNIFAVNVGMHNEHHDFSDISGTRLEYLRKIAPEYYDNIPCHHSWIMVLVNWVLMGPVNPSRRVIRSFLDKSDGKQYKVPEVPETENKKSK